MSSHHVVRDEQEPAVIIASPPGDLFPRLADMFEWSPIVVVLEEALPDFLHWNTKLDVVAGNTNSLVKYKEQLIFQEPYQKVESSEAVLETVLEYLIKNNHRTSHVFMLTPEPKKLQQRVGDKMELVFFDREMKIVQSKTNMYGKWVAKGTKFKLVEGTIQHFENVLRNDDLFEAKENGFVSFYGESAFWIGEILK